jgi:hypothetical protein
MFSGTYLKLLLANTFFNCPEENFMQMIEKKNIINKLTNDESKKYVHVGKKNMSRF